MFNSIYYCAFHPHPYGIISIFSISRFLLYHPPCFLGLVDCCIKIPLRQFPLLRCRYLCYRRPRGRRYATSAWSTRPRGRRPRGRRPRGRRPRGRRGRRSGVSGSTWGHWRGGGFDYRIDTVGALLGREPRT